MIHVFGWRESLHSKKTSLTSLNKHTSSVWLWPHPPSSMPWRICSHLRRHCQGFWNPMECPAQFKYETKKFILVPKELQRICSMKNLLNGTHWIQMKVSVAPKFYHLHLNASAMTFCRPFCIDDLLASKNGCQPNGGQN